MLDGYIPLLIVLVLLIAGMIGLFSVLPSLSEGRYKKSKGVSLKPDDIVYAMVKEKGPKVKDGAYLEPYESGEVARGEIGKFVTVQYFVIILLFVVFDIDIVLLFPWAMDFYQLGFLPFIETLVFLAMPLFVVLYAFKQGYMRWQR